MAEREPAGAADQVVLSLHRPFSWGIAIIGDSRSTTFPSLGPNGEIAHEGTCVVVQVRHAQDFDFEAGEGPATVSGECRLASPPGSPTFESIIEVPSGILTVGDAEHEDQIAVEPGRWAIAVNCSPTKQPEQIRVWLSPVDI